MYIFKNTMIGLALALVAVGCDGNFNTLGEVNASGADIKINLLTSPKLAPPSNAIVRGTSFAPLLAFRLQWGTDSTTFTESLLMGLPYVETITVSYVGDGQFQDLFLVLTECGDTEKPDDAYGCVRRGNPATIDPVTKTATFKAEMLSTGSASRHFIVAASVNKYGSSSGRHALGIRPEDIKGKKMSSIAVHAPDVPTTAEGSWIRGNDFPIKGGYAVSIAVVHVDPVAAPGFDASFTVSETSGSHFHLATARLAASNGQDPRDPSLGFPGVTIEAWQQTFHDAPSSVDASVGIFTSMPVSNSMRIGIKLAQPSGTNATITPQLLHPSDIRLRESFPNGQALQVCLSPEQPGCENTNANSSFPGIFAPLSLPPTSCRDFSLSS